MTGIRGIMNFTLSMGCVTMVVAGLYLSMGNPGEGAVLDQPGAPVRLVSDQTSATAFFELNGDRLDLTVLFSENDDPESIFRTRVSLIEGQSHTLVVGDSEDGGARRFTFRRTGYSITMRLAPTANLNASIGFWN